MKRSSKIRKKLLLTLFWVVFLSAFLAILTRNRWVQKQLSQWVASEISESLGAEVTVNYVEVDFLRNFHIEGLLLKDQQKDTLLSIGSIDLKLDDWKIAKKKFDIINLDLFKPRVFMGVYSNTNRINHEFLFDNLQQDTQKSKPFNFRFSNTRIIDGEYVFYRGYRNKLMQKPDKFNPNFIQYSKINSEIPEFKIDTAGLHFDIKYLKTKEGTGKMVSIITKFNIKDGILDFNPLVLTYNNTELNGQFTMSPIPNMPKNPFLDINYYLRVDNGEFDISDLGVYADYLKNHSLKLSPTFEIQGPLNNIKTKYFNAITENGSQIDLEYHIKGMEKPDSIWQKIVFNGTYLSQEDIEKWFENDDFKEYLNPIQDIEMDAEFTLPAGRVIMNGSINSSVGQFSGNYSLNYSKRENSIPMSINGKLENLRPKLFRNIGYDLPIDHVYGKVNISGNDFNELASWNCKLNLTSLKYNNVEIAGIDISGKIDQGNLSINSFSDAQSLSHNLDLQVTGVFNAKHRMQLLADLKKMDLQSLGLDTTNSKYFGQVKCDITGSCIDDYIGFISIENSKISRGFGEFQLIKQEVSRYEADKISLNGDWVVGEITGPIKFSNTSDWINHFAHYVAPERFVDSRKQLTDSIFIDLFIPQTGWIDAFVLPGLQFGPLRIKGNYFAKDNICKLKVGPFSMEYGDIQMERVNCFIDKPTKYGLAKMSINTDYVKVNKTVYDTFGLAFEMLKGGYSITSRIHDKSDRYSFLINANGSIHKDFANMYFGSTYINILNQIWVLDPKARIDFTKNRWTVNDFYLADENHYIEIDGVAGASNSDTLHIDFGNITPNVLTPFFAKGSFDSLLFRSNGDVRISSTLGSPKFLGNIDVNQIFYQGYSYGDASTWVRETDVNGLLNFETSFRDGPIANTDFRGTVKLMGKGPAQINILGNIPNESSLDILRPFLAGVVTIKNGKFGGNVRISGTSEEPKILGLLTTNKFGLNIDYLGTEYLIGGNFKITDEGLYTMSPIKVSTPSKRGSALFTLELTHDRYKDFRLNLKVDSIKQMQILNTTEKSNDLFYGKAWASGDCRIHGPLSLIDMDINLTTENGSDLSILYPQVSQNSLVGSVTFVKKGHSTDKKQLKENEQLQSGEDDALGEINLNINANQNAQVNFVIDKRLGDVISGRGVGDIRLLYSKEGDFSLFGTYKVGSGSYSFSLPGINIIKKIDLIQGGTIRWDGDVFDAVVDLSGSFEKRVSPSALMITSGSSESSYPTTRFLSVLRMKGNLFSPSISFDIQAPDLKSNTSSNTAEVVSIVERIRSDKDEAMRQSISLLLFGNFLPPSFMASTAPTTSNFSSTGIAGNSISTLASSVVNDLFVKYGIPTRIQVNIDDIRNTTGTTNTQLFVNSEWFLSDRLRLDLNYDPTVAMLVNTVALPLNFNLEYKTKDENWRLKAFSRSNNLIFNNTTTTNGVSGNTLGAGVLYRRDFDTFKREKKDEK